jgi:hypothetical protein
MFLMLPPALQGGSALEPEGHLGPVALGPPPRRTDNIWQLDWSIRSVVPLGHLLPIDRSVSGVCLQRRSARGASRVVQIDGAPPYLSAPG